MPIQICRRLAAINAQYFDDKHLANHSKPPAAISCAHDAWGSGIPLWILDAVAGGLPIDPTAIGVAHDPIFRSARSDDRRHARGDRRSPGSCFFSLRTSEEIAE